jgi:hypothetical protein
MNHTFLQLYFMFLIIADVYLSPINDYGLELWHMCHHLYTTELIWSIFVSGSIYRFMFLLLKRMIFNVTILLYDFLFQSLLYLTKCDNTGRGCRALDYKRRWEAYTSGKRAFGQGSLVPAVTKGLATLLLIRPRVRHPLVPV